MDGLAADIDGGKPGWRQNDGVGRLFAFRPQRPQQGRFAGAGAAGDEQRPVAFIDVVDHRPEFVGQLEAGWQRRNGCAAAASGPARLRHHSVLF